MNTSEIFTILFFVGIKERATEHLLSYVELEIRLTISVGKSASNWNVALIYSALTLWMETAQRTAPS